MTDLNNTTPLSLPYYQYVKLDGNSLFNAKIYVGIANTDPTNVANQIDVLAVQAGGTTTILDQPIRTNSAGYAVDDIGNIVYPVVSDDYSITVTDQNDALLYEESTVFVNPSESLVTTINTLPVTISAGQTVINVPDLPNSVNLFIPLAQEPDVDFTYNKVTGDITVVVAFTGNEQVWVQYGAVVSITGNIVDGVNSYVNIAAAIADSNLLEGDVFVTNAYHSMATDGAAKYVVSTTTGTSGQLNNIPLTASGFFAQIIPLNNVVTVAQAGAKFTDEGVAGFDDDALDDLILYAIANGVKAIHEGKEAHYYRSHPILSAINFEGVGEDSILRCHGDFILLDMSDSSTFYNNTIIGNMTLQSNGAQADTAMKIHGLFEASVVKDMRVVGFRYGMHLTEQFNGTYRNVYVRQAANRHAPNEGNDPVPSYGWWLDGVDGQLNAISFINCGAERNWHNVYVDNSADVGGFVALNFTGGVFQTAWESGFVVEGNARITLDGVYFENNWEAAQRISDGHGVLADQGVNITVKGITGLDQFQMVQTGGYQQMSSNLKNNTPIDQVMNFFLDATMESVFITVDGVNVVANDPSSYDWDYYIAGGTTEFVPAFGLVKSSKPSSSSIFVIDNGWYDNTHFSFMPDDGSGSNFSSDFRTFTTPVSSMFFEIRTSGAYTATTAPEYVIQELDGTNVATLVLPTFSGANSIVLAQLVLSLTPGTVYRLAQSVTISGSSGTPNFSFKGYLKSLTRTTYTSIS